MPAHAQQQILQALAATLVAAGTQAAARVFVDRADPLQATDLPAILVDESSEGETLQPTLGSIYERALAVRITCVVAATSAALAQARELGKEVEQALAVPGTPVALLARGGLVLQTSRPSQSPESDRLLALREQEWQVSYFTTPQAPDVFV
jgi:hypothetical protein